MKTQFPSLPPSTSRWLCAFCAPLALALAVSGAHGAALSPADLSLEELLNTEVYSASDYVSGLGQSPSATSVIDAEEIRTQGYRTLADILRSLPGLHVTNDRDYSYLGARGFGRPEDYNSRVLFLLDGYRLNENVYDSALLGNEALLSVDLIERVEYIPGPGAAIFHGKNAFFGVVNIITKRGAQLDGGRLSWEVASADTTDGHASFGRRLDNGLDFLVSASRYRRGGDDLYFPEFAGSAIGLDHDHADRLFAKFSFREFSLKLAHVEREKGIPNASYGQLFNDPASRTLDQQSLVDLSYNLTLGADSALGARLYYGQYDFTGDYVYDANAGVPPVSPYVNRDRVIGRWLGAELRYVAPRLGSHKWLVGADFQRNLRQDQSNFDLGGALYLDDRRRDGDIWGVFLHDEYAFSENLTFNLGARYDQPLDGSGEFHPRLGIVYRWNADTTLKALYGSAFRAPNAYERYYTDGSTYVFNPNLQPERIRTYELVLERHLRNAGLLTLSLFHYRIKDLIEFVTLPGADLVVGTGDDMYTFANLGGARARGVELRYDKKWDNGASLRASHDWQLAETDAGTWLDNSPQRMTKLSLEAPLPRGSWRAGLEIQYMGPRRIGLGGEVGGHTLVNVNLLNRELMDNLELSFSVVNLFDRRYADPASSAFSPLDRIVQGGRAWSARLEYRF